MLIVIDTSVIVAGLRSRQGGSNRLLQLVSQGHLRPLFNTPLFLEYEAVLKRPEHQLATGLGPAQIDVFFGRVGQCLSGCGDALSLATAVGFRIYRLAIRV